MPLELDSLQSAVASLVEVIAVSDDASLMRGLPEPGQRAIKAGVIQHFEFTYELSWKFMKRWLESNVSPIIADGITRRELFRLAAEHRLIDDVERWMRHHNARNNTSHLYQRTVADAIFADAPEFCRDAQRLLANLEAHND